MTMRFRCGMHVRPSKGWPLPHGTVIGPDRSNHKTMNRHPQSETSPAWASRSALAVVVLCTLATASCRAPQVILGPRTCTIKAWDPVDFSLWDVLPGVESALQRERTYFVRGALQEGTETQGTWWLATDTAFTPMVLRPMEDGIMKWTGTRDFIASIRAVAVKDSTSEARPALNLGNEAWLIREKDGLCLAHALPEARHLGTTAMP